MLSLLDALLKKLLRRQHLPWAALAGGPYLTRRMTPNQTHPSRGVLAWPPWLRRRKKLHRCGPVPGAACA